MEPAETAATPTATARYLGKPPPGEVPALFAPVTPPVALEWWPMNSQPLLPVTVLPDSAAHGLGDAAEPLYTVAFPSDALWANPEHARDEVMLDLWQSYLEPAP